MRGLGPAHQAVLRGLQAITILGLCLLPALVLSALTACAKEATQMR